MSLTERRKDDRALMAGTVAELAVMHGLSAVVTGEQHGSRQTSVDIAGPHTLGVTVRFRGDSPQDRPDTYVLSWHMRPWADEGKGWSLNPAAFVDQRSHDTKATDVARGFDTLAGLLARRFAAIADGSAFVTEGIE
jgi:hypothetical protein